MRTLTTQETKTLGAASGYAAWSRFSVKDPTGAWQDLSALRGYNWIVSWSYRFGIDDQAASLEVQLHREIYSLSLATLLGGSVLNVNGSLLAPAAECKMEACCMPSGVAPSAGDWREIFHGYIDAVDSGTDPITVTARDLAGIVQQRFIRRERPYSNVTGVLVETLMQNILDDNFIGEVWVGGHTYYAGDIVRATSGGTQYTYQAQAQGVSGVGAPAWGAVVGGNTTDNTITWKNLGASSVFAVTLQTPTSPAWVVKGPWQQQKKPTFDAINDLAAQVGWSLRYIWNSSLSAFALTFFDPGRTKVTPDWTIAANQYYDVTKLLVDGSTVRNWIQVVYPNYASVDNVGNPLPTIVVARDAASIAKYGESFMEISEGATSRITDSTQATTLANNVLSDLKDPKAVHEISTPFFWPVELGDLWQFAANSVQYDSTQKFAVIGIEHQVSADQHRTIVQTRGVPAAAYTTWLERGARPGGADVSMLTAPAAPTNVTATAIRGGATISFTPPPTNLYPDYAGTQLHVSTTNAFTPSSATLVSQLGGNNTAHSVSTLTPGTTYYAVVIPIDSNGNQGSPSSQVSFVAAYTAPSSLQPTISYLSYPYNGGFEAWSNGTSGVAPDAWTAVGSVAAASKDTTHIFDGYAALAANGSVGNVSILSAPIPVIAGQVYRVAWQQSVSAVGGAASGCVAHFNFYNGAGTSVGTTTLTQSTSTTWPTWQPVLTHSLQAFAGAVYMTVELDLTPVSGFTMYLDSVSISKWDGVVASYYNTTIQSIPSGALTVINFANQVTDTDQAVTTGAGWHFTCPTYKNGLYLVEAALGLNNSGAAGDFFISVLKGGAEFKRGARVRMPTNPGVGDASISTSILLADGDTVAIAVYQQTTIAQPTEAGTAINNWVQITRILPYVNPP